ncbi:hypothetical protein Y032_0068g189 [Ancylostoma ceylanicum]|nr:hypothetical protein Y032_0068g189 [Ancylostoma ceylanicum]
MYYARGLVSKSPLILAAMFRFWFFFSTVCFLNAVLVERSIASYFVADYEKKPRVWLSTAMNGVSLSTSLLITITFMLRCVVGGGELEWKCNSAGDWKDYLRDDLVSKLPLLIASLLRMWFFIAAAGFLKAVLVERACASYFIVDYENKARQWISTTIIVFSLFATFVFTISFMFMLYPVVAGLAGGSFSALAALAVSAILYRRNRSQLLNLDKGITAASIEYTLSIKFQLMENIRVMRIVVATFCLMAGVIVFALSLLALAFIQFDEFPDKAQLCFAFYDLIVALTITFLTLAFAVHMGEWRRVYLHFPPTIRQFCLRKFAALEGKRVTHIREHENAGQQYFDQLKKAWGN